MKVVIVGCGRVGSTLADHFDKSGHEVVIFDLRNSAFDRLNEGFKGAAIRGDGTDEEVLRIGGAEGADIFLALTEGDNRNIMAAQVAAETLGVPRVIAKINDPLRADAYSDLGLATLCRTNLMVEAVSGYLEMPMEAGPGIKEPTGSHHHDERRPLIAEAPGVRPLASPLAPGASPGVEGSGIRPAPRDAAKPSDGEAAEGQSQQRESRGFRFRRG